MLPFFLNSTECHGSTMFYHVSSIRSEASNPRNKATQEETQRSQTLHQVTSQAPLKKTMRSYESPRHALSEKNINVKEALLIESD